MAWWNKRKMPRHCRRWHCVLPPAGYELTKPWTMLVCGAVERRFRCSAHRCSCAQIMTYFRSSVAHRHEYVCNEKHWIRPFCAGKALFFDEYLSTSLSEPRTIQVVSTNHSALHRNFHTHTHSLKLSAPHHFQCANGWWSIRSKKKNRKNVSPHRSSRTRRDTTPRS